MWQGRHRPCTLDQHIVQIRRKLGAAGAAVETVRGAGYRYRAP